MCDPRPHSRAAHRLLLAGGLGLLISACGSGGSSAAVKTPPSVSPSPTTTPARSGPRPGAFGTVAAISGSSLEVQDPSTGQTTVNVDSSTRINTSATVTTSALSPGMCASAVGTRTSSGVIDANSVTLSQPSGSSCSTTGGPGFGGGFPGGQRGAGRLRPGGAANGSGGSNGTAATAPRRPPANLARADGTLSSVSGSTLQIKGATSTTGVQVTSSTRLSEIQATSISALKVGDCVAAFGSIDSIGAVTARTLTVTPAGPNGCTGGFAGRGA